MITEILKEAAHFRNLPREALKRLARGFAKVRVPADGKVYEAGEPVEGLFVVAEGTVVVFRGAPGEEGWPVARLCRGDLLGTADLFDSQRHSETACALKDCVVLKGERRWLLDFLADRPDVTLNLRLAAARDLTTRAKIALEVAQLAQTLFLADRQRGSCIHVHPSGPGPSLVQGGRREKRNASPPEWGSLLLSPDVAYPNTSCRISVTRAAGSRRIFASCSARTLKIPSMPFSTTYVVRLALASGMKGSCS